MPQAFACLLLLLASLANGLVILPYKPRAQPPHGLSSHPLGVRFMHNLTAVKHARLYFKLHHRDLTNNTTTDWPGFQLPTMPDKDTAQDYIADVFKHAFDPVYDFLTDMIDMLSKSRAPEPTRRHTPSMLY